MSKKISENVGIKGFFRLQIKENGKVVGESGWKENQITNDGYEDFIVGRVGSIAGASFPAYMALGTGTAPASNATALPGELTDAAGCRFTFTPSAVSSKTLRMVGSLNSNIITAARTIQNIGLFASSAITAGTVMAGNTYATSALATNQTVDATYEIRFA